MRASVGAIALALIVVVAATGSSLAETSSAEDSIEAILDWLSVIFTLVLLFGIFLTPDN